MQFLPVSMKSSCLFLLYSDSMLGIAPSTAVPGSLGTQSVVQPVIITLFLFLSRSLPVYSRNMDSCIQQFYMCSPHIVCAGHEGFNHKLLLSLLCAFLVRTLEMVRN